MAMAGIVEKNPEYKNITARTVTFSDGTEKDIAITVTIGDVQVDLRDDDCTPLWRGGRDGQALNLSSMTN